MCDSPDQAAQYHILGFYVRVSSLPRTVAVHIVKIFVFGLRIGQVLHFNILDFGVSYNDHDMNNKVHGTKGYMRR
jgi:hypothetical protein